MPNPTPIPCPASGCEEGRVQVRCGCAGRDNLFHCSRCGDTGLAEEGCEACGGDGIAKCIEHLCGALVVEEYDGEPLCKEHLAETLRVEADLTELCRISDGVDSYIAKGRP